ncbi:MAG: S8 family serine peptidase, partial [Pseudomonadota bacterium]
MFPYFELTAEIRLPADVGRDVLNAAIDAVVAARSTPHSSRPIVNNLVKGSIPLDTGAVPGESENAIYACEEADADCEKIISDEKPQWVVDSEVMMRRIKNAIHWKPETIEANPIQNGAVQVRVFDPGFKALDAKGLPKLCSSGTGAIEATAACITKTQSGLIYDGEWREAVEVWLKSDGKEVGHGLHVAFIAAGKSDKKGFNWPIESGEPIVGIPSGQNDNTNPQYLDSAKVPPIANRSYMNNNAVNANGGLTTAALRAAAVKEAGPSPETPEFSVVASPYISSDADTMPSCLAMNSIGDDYPPDGPSQMRASIPFFCMGRHLYGMTVVGAAPIAGNERRDSWLNGWAPMLNPGQEADGGEREYILASHMRPSKKIPFLDPTKTNQFLWIAAPGEDVVSKDVFVAQDGKTTALGFASRSGSSQAAALVTSLVARTKSKMKDYSWHKTKSWIFANATPFPESPTSPKIDRADYEL